MKSIRFVFFVAITLMAQPTFAQYNELSGLPLIQNYGSEEYNAGIQNWSIIQQSNGLLYIANNMGLLEYDGHTWESYTVPNKTKIRSLFIDKNDNIYVGSQRDFGYFSADKSGTLAYTSLADSLPDKFRDFDETWKIYGQDELVYFCTFSEIFVYDGNNIEVISSDFPLEISFFHNNELYSQEWGNGLSKLQGGALRLVSNGEFFSDKRISNIFNYDNENWLISTFDHGLFMYNNGTIKAMSIDPSLDLRRLIVNYSTRLSNGQIALGTQNGGLIIINKEGQLIRQIDQSTGLRDRTVNFIYEDLQSNLWLTLNNGLSRVDLNSPFTLINERMDISGSGYTALKAPEGTYLGTNNGLYLFKDGLMSFIEGTAGQVYSVQRIADRLFIGHHNGPMEIRNGKSIQLYGEKGAWVFKRHPQKMDVIFEGTYLGLNRFDLSEVQEAAFEKLEGFRESSRIMEFDDDYLWVTQGYKGAFRLELSEDLKTIENVKLYNSQNGFPSDLLINVYKINNKLIFTSERGFFQYNSEKDFFEPLENFNELLGTESSIVDMETDEIGNIYFIESNKLGILEPKGDFDYDLSTNSFNKIRNLLNDDLGNITVIDNDNVLIGAREGFIHYARSKDVPKRNAFNIMFRNVTNSGKIDSTLVNGHMTEQSGVPKFRFSQNSFAFSFAAPHFESNNQVNYQFKLDEYDEEWSDWTASNFKEYTNLREGNYTFSVRAKNIFDQETETIGYEFEVTPPIYRTTFAYAFYGLGSLMLLFTGFKTLEARYKKNAQRLEDVKNQEIKEKEFQIEHITLKSEEEIIRLKNEKLTTEVGLKSQALTSSAMNLIQKNQLLNQIKNTLKNLNKEIEEKQHVTQLNRIVKSIDRDLASGEEWGQFQDNFDQVHGQFITRLKEAFPGLTPQELKFSAYIRMNLNTKEIANLLNISVRGVEIGRYRVRKKLKLERKDNLSDFILRF
ncbi:triple tyrosine motif-containing protein [Roseivirga sp. E12]|uniref:triple tyrosine motif-containing protein n=1 Tax=Roseivirga sp. E12 TaxID=2819237 RepID=UPI001ABD3237|nr:triple tyrosine motif-containing protein [Roseivirga sp. E12]MBO3697506.1 two component regulator three y domain-containing protein [Roseivirga sp. E12]